MGGTTVVERVETTGEEGEVHSYDNVFEALALPDPDLRAAKADLSIAFEERIRQLGITQVEAAERAGLTQSDVSLIVRGRLARFGLERLIRAVNALGMDVDIVVHPPKEEPGKIQSTLVTAQPGP